MPRVVVVNSSLTTLTGVDGRYTLRGVPTGSIEVRVLRVGYTEQKKSVSVAAWCKRHGRLHDGASDRSAPGSRDDRDR
jgi:hypothetical protein